MSEVQAAVTSATIGHYVWSVPTNLTSPVFALLNTHRATDATAHALDIGAAGPPDNTSNKMPTQNSTGVNNIAVVPTCLRAKSSK